MVSNVRGCPFVASGPLPERMRRLKLSLSWLIVVLGFLVGLVVCVKLGFAHVASLNGSPAPHLTDHRVAGMAWDQFLERHRTWGNGSFREPFMPCPDQPLPLACVQTTARQLHPREALASGPRNPQRASGDKPR